MIILSVDYGDKRTGIAVCDKFEMLASPVCVITEWNIDSLANIHTLSLPNSLIRIGECAFSDITINKINYRGTTDDCKKVVIEEDGLSYETIEFGGNNNA